MPRLNISIGPNWWRCDGDHDHLLVTEVNRPVQGFHGYEVEVGVSGIAEESSFIFALDDDAVSSLSRFLARQC